LYEAGPTGFGSTAAAAAADRLHRRGPLEDPAEKACARRPTAGTPSKLARLHRAGELAAIYVPDAVDESIRDLTRARPTRSRT